MKICKHKDCIHRGEPQSLNNFYKNKSKKDGYATFCKDCEKNIEN